MTSCEKKPFENNMGKGENAGNQHFLLFPQCFTLPKTKFNFSATLNFVLSSANAFNLDLSKILLFVKKLCTLQMPSNRPLPL